ncbi:MAG: alpha/beta hydrolase [Flavobacterium sp.]|uniref:alpha/beta fold hydrolase n=1 Tax=Flavobacterium sp. TaxID=239 RepID=UPI00121BC20D|nr:alpha/beta hydrolase [Flavobacterium sp.]RZJ66180.1 MAG: alpha/beta hydrolase [Flavobacterium sp.]
MQQQIASRNNVKIFGAGQQTIIFAHGFGCDQNMWRFVVPAFVDDYRIVLFDYVGCGKSDLTAYNHERYVSLDGYAQDVIDICKELDLQDAIFVGHSVSCMIGVLAAIRHPEFFSSLVFIGPSPCYINDSNYKGGFEKKDLEDLLNVMESNYIGWANFLAPVVMKNEDRPELMQELEESFCSTDPIITKRFAQATFFSDNRSDLSKIKLPVLVMQCSDDAIAPDFVGEFTAQKIHGSEIVKMQATGHCPHLSHPDETIAIIKNFLAKTYLTA